MANGTEIHQWEFHGGNSQKWIFDYYGDGYYTLKSANSTSSTGDLYLGIKDDLTTEEAPAVLRAGTITDGMLWSVSTTVNDAYRLTPKTGNWCLAVDGSTSNNGEIMYQDWYAGHNDSYRDEWDIIQHPYVHNIEHYFDQGYDVRFGNSYSDISEYQTVCADILSEIFGIDVNFNIHSYISCADECTGASSLYDTTAICTHSYTDHKTRGEVRSDLITKFGNGDSLLTRVIWTGHVLESRSSNSSSATNTVVITIGKVTDAQNNNLSSSVIRYQYIYTLLHESSHQLGAPDHYCYDQTSTDCNNPSQDCWRCDNNLPNPPNCLMSFRMYDLENRLNNGTIYSIYCTQCMSSIHEKGILTHLNDHHYLDY